MKLSEVLKKEAVLANLDAADKTEVLKELSSFTADYYSSLNEAKLLEVLTAREKICSTALDEGVAIPHGKLSGINGIIAVFARKKDGVNFDSLDGNPTQLFMLLLSPENSTGEHINALARISKIFKNKMTRSKLLEANSKEEIYDILIEEDEKL